jgi:hypothetical protein
MIPRLQYATKRPPVQVQAVLPAPWIRVIMCVGKLPVPDTVALRRSLTIRRVRAAKQPKQLLIAAMRLLRTIPRGRAAKARRRLLTLALLVLSIHAS